jgi:hypothetical protein
MTWIAIGIALAGAAANAYNTQQTAKKQDRALAAKITQQGQKQQMANAKIAEALAAQEGSDQRDEQSALMDNYVTTLQQGRQGSGFNDGPGGFSEAYRQGVGQAQEAVQGYGNTRADLMSRVDAPRLQRVNEGVLFDSLANDLRMIGREASGDAYLDDLRIRGIVRDPWLDAFSSVAGAYGKGAAGQGVGADYSIGPVVKQPITFQ